MLKDDISSTDHTFIAKKGEFQVSLRLQGDVLLISLENIETMEVFSTEMTQEKIKGDQKFGFFFEKASQLYLFLAESWEAIRVSKIGRIQFQMEMPFGKGTKKYSFVIDTVRRQVDQKDLLDLRLSRMSKEIAQLRLDNIQIRKQMKAKEQDHEKMKLQLHQLNRILQQKDEVINAVFQDLKELNRWRQEKDKQIESLQKNKRKFVADASNPHISKFTQISNRFKKITGGSWDLLLCKYEIDPGEKYRYNIKQVRAGSNGSFMYGIGTGSIRGVNRAQDHKQFIGYYENTGNIYDKGESKKGGPKIKDGDTITIEIDTKEWKITWYIEGCKEAECTIGGELRVKPIYLAIVVFNQESQLEFV